MENSMELPQKTKSRITIWSSNPTPGHISGQNSNSKKYMHFCVHCSLIIFKIWEKPRGPLREGWMDKGDVAYIHNAISLSHKKGSKSSLWQQHRWPWRYYVKWNNSEGEGQIYKCYVITLICRILKKEKRWKSEIKAKS